MSCKRPASSPAASAPDRKRTSYGLDIKHFSHFLLLLSNYTTINYENSISFTK